MVLTSRLGRAAVAFLMVASAALLAATTVASVANASSTRNAFSPRMLVRVGSSQVVYVLGYVPCQHSYCLRLLRTDDNGTSFAKRTPPPTEAIKYSIVGTLDQLVFANPAVGFALEGESGGQGVDNGTQLYATYDGARTWKKVVMPVGDELSRVAVSSDMLYGVIMHCAKQVNSNVGCSRYRLVHTSLAVTHWSSAAIPNGRSYPWGFLGNVAASGSKVWMTEGAKWSLLVSSKNHGRSFTTLAPTFPALGSVAGCDLTAMSTSALWAACPTGMEVSFAFSSDAGAEWNEVPTHQFMGTGGGYFDPVSSTVAYLDYGGTRSLYRVSDGGRVMTKVGALQCSKINSSIGAITFTTPRFGMAVCTPEGLWSTARLVRTTNGGTTWSRINP
jgi:photosystem II stability/assembly factor-like uncharacterized protein